MRWVVTDSDIYRSDRSLDCSEALLRYVLVFAKQDHSMRTYELRRQQSTTLVRQTGANQIGFASPLLLPSVDLGCDSGSIDLGLGDGSVAG